MTLLPIVSRELRVAARRWNVYWGRVVTAGIALVVFAWVTQFIMPGMGVPLSVSGSWIFANLVVITAVYGALGGLVATSDILSQEKREGTLGLLFLTDLRGYDVVLGKLVAAAVRSLYSMLAIVPVLTVVLAMGGVTYLQVAQAAVAIGSLVLFSMALGMRVSVVSVSERKALFAGWLLLLLCVMGPWLAVGLIGVLVMGSSLLLSGGRIVIVLSPFYPVVHLVSSVAQGAAGRVFNPANFWLSIALVQVMAWGMLFATSRSIVGVWQAPQSLRGLARVQHGWEQWIYGQGRSRAALRRRLLGVNPFLWVLQRERLKAWYAWGYLAIVLSFWLVGNWHSDRILYEVGVAIPTLLLIQGFLKVWVISECVSRLVEDRRAGAMELLLTTPLSHTGVVEGYWLALRRLFMGPALALAGFEFLVLGQVLGRGIGLFSALVLVADMLSVSSAAIWYGLIARGANRALLRVIALVLVLPWVLIGMWLAAAASFRPQLGAWAEPDFMHGFVAWCVISLLVDSACVAWCGARTREHFRRIVSEGLGGSVFGLKSVP